MYAVKTIIRRHKYKPWFNYALRKKIEKEIAVKSNKAEDINLFKKSRNKINNTTNHAIDNYYNDLEFTLLNSNNSKLYWKLLKKMLSMLNRHLKNWCSLLKSDNFIFQAL